MHTPTLIGPSVDLRHARVRPPSSDIPVVVQKYGGTLLRNVASRTAVAEQVRSTRATGRPVVVVASAMGREGEPYATDTLLGLAADIGGSVDPRTRDLLASCGEVISTALLAHLLSHSGLPAIPLTGRDAGIVTDDRFGDASVVSVQPLRVLRVLKSGYIPVVAGFQGRSASGDVTTLGRGGSDTSAVALAAAIGAEVEFFKDVDGMLTADPRLVPTARTISRMSYADAALASRLGARVLHQRAAEMAAAHCVPLRVRALSSCPGSGTAIVATGTMTDGGVMVVAQERTGLSSLGRARCGCVSVVGPGVRAIQDPLRLGREAIGGVGAATFSIEQAPDGRAISWLVPTESLAPAALALHQAFVEQFAPHEADSSLALRVA